jgi:hypothetical protein
LRENGVFIANKESLRLKFDIFINKFWKKLLLKESNVEFYSNFMSKAEYSFVDSVSKSFIQ